MDIDKSMDDLIKLLEDVKLGFHGHYLEIDNGFIDQPIKNKNDFIRFCRSISENSSLYFGETIGFLLSHYAENSTEELDTNLNSQT